MPFRFKMRVMSLEQAQEFQQVQHQDRCLIGLDTVDFRCLSSVSSSFSDLLNHSKIKVSKCTQGKKIVKLLQQDFPTAWSAGCDFLRLA